jgi:SPX domain protein involved in polyphosphate accumulation
MKFGEHLLQNMDPRWKEYYLDYARLKKVIKQLSAACLGDVSQERHTSLSFGRGAAASSRQTHDANRAFLDMLEQEIKKIDKFVASLMVDIRTKLRDIEAQVEFATKPENAAAAQGIDELRKQADTQGKQFLSLEKFINLNFNGFHKILKKHDKQMPESFACKNFYVGKLHTENWVKGDYSDVLVQLSRIHSKMRQDKAAAANHDAAQAFVRTTTKYWVKTEDVSRVKYNLLQHLPVFLQEGSAPGSDSQLTNSVYLDNGRMELYKGRLDKTPGAIALRLRWYGPGDPKDVFVERKTHRESWTGELSVSTLHCTLYLCSVLSIYASLQ